MKTEYRKVNEKLNKVYALINLYNHAEMSLAAMGNDKSLEDRKSLAIAQSKISKHKRRAANLNAKLCEIIRKK